MENKKDSQRIKTSTKAARSLSSMYVLLREQYSIVFFIIIFYIMFVVQKK